MGKRSIPVSEVIIGKIYYIQKKLYNPEFTSVTLGYDDYYSFMSEPDIYGKCLILPNQNGPTFDGIPINRSRRKRYIRVNYKK